MTSTLDLVRHYLQLTTSELGNGITAKRLYSEALLSACRDFAELLNRVPEADQGKRSQIAQDRRYGAKGHTDTQETPRSAPSHRSESESGAPETDDRPRGWWSIRPEKDPSFNPYCPRCQADNHNCPGCGNSLAHDGKEFDSSKHECLALEEEDEWDR